MKLNLIVSVIIILGILYYFNMGLSLERFTNHEEPSPTETNYDTEVNTIKSRINILKNLSSTYSRISPPNCCRLPLTGNEESLCLIHNLYNCCICFFICLP